MAGGGARLIDFSISWTACFSREGVITLDMIGTSGSSPTCFVVQSSFVLFNVSKFWYDELVKVVREESEM